MTTAERLIEALKDIAIPITGDSCHLCGKKEWESQASGYSVIVQQCDECDLMVCDECASTDFDWVGEPGNWKVNQWVCKGGCKYPIGKGDEG